MIYHIKNTKGKKHTIISIDEEKTLDKIQYPFKIKTLSKVGTEGKYINVIKAFHDKPRANIICSGAKLKAFPLRSGTRKEGDGPVH